MNVSKHNVAAYSYVKIILKEIKRGVNRGTQNYKAMGDQLSYGVLSMKCGIKCKLHDVLTSMDLESLRIISVG